ncbi:chromatin modification-related protein YNG2 [Yamadazyma tenuis ATCC 10573]|uniref:Chromatin modification-related protein n=1 Tax=Candida tenuis (strain ATCC 10573 / BCRC 21748 / CBS 615 / JCM 9827 / NBRC 10315 / NRRL Y-1498 / VKM Y-70) TaxID=590646 RepID=G3BFP2_CANTC|nr:chromatin modification-related protein YNG2 [Yamadazyma tenuis ATCC 10573]EGV60067.1 chromatin modification-related protein YNG2 [Yamadazyma tenuis ATCC 10573]
MDTTAVIDKYTQDISNLPLEIRYIFEEIHNKDIQLMEARRRYQAKDSQIHKLIKQSGTQAKHPKEPQVYAKIEEDLQLVEKIQKEKILLANTALFLISKHLFNFETDITKLERDELIPAIDNVYEIEGGPQDGTGGVGRAYSDVSASATPRSTLSLTPGVESSALQRKAQKRKAMMKAGVRPYKRSRMDDDDDDDESQPDTPGRHDGPGGDDADNTLYCLCQRVSFGEMIACDNEDCRFEWFHWQCVGITSTPKDNVAWYCPDCAPRMEKRKKKKKT